ncbi:MAG: hypothetical protein ACKVXR_11705 [Planctomycetota bacterium]
MPMLLRPLAPFSVLACLTGLLAAACGGGGSGSSEFAIIEISVPHNGTWQVNRPMTFEFTSEVDFSTVNLNTINIAQAGGAPASGEFFEVDPFTVGFQPRCPTTDDFSDSGLIPGGVAYTIRIPGSTSGGMTVRSESGARLTESQTVDFSTPNSSEASVIFLDAQIGPPIPVIRTSATDPNLSATYLELGNDPANREYFFARPLPDAALGAKVTDGFTAGLNLYSDTSSHVSILVAINQPVTPSAANINIDTVRLEYRTAAGTWENVAHTVQLVANCTAAGALVRVTPTGILPQNRIVRVLLTRDFRDLVGDSNLVDLTVGSFLVKTATDPGTTTPGVTGDEAFEEFAVGGSSSASREDTTSVLASPRADWGEDGSLRAGFAFGGTGGPGGTFDWKIGNDLPLSNTNRPQVLLDTSFSVITNQQQTAQQTVINGVVDLRNLLVTASGQLLILGPNRCTILVSGNAQIDGEITISGADNLSVASLNTTAQAEPGAAGRGGGGRGGAGSPLSSQSSAAGETGRGAFNAAGAGGVGGESGFRATWPLDSFDQNRRPAGGGGGSLGPDFLRPQNIAGGYLNPNLCPDQIVIGLDAERGYNGSPLATGVLSNVVPPQGGSRGPRPFFDADPNNDFWGTMRTQTGSLIRGELPDPWAGAGGGGGGDAIVSNSFPTTPFNPFGDEKGAGGGGGAGSITILALGSIKFGPRGRILANGGTGGGGENSGGGNITHIGGGSGGGSGGHIVLQSATQIDLSPLITTTGVNLPAGGLYAVGGQGGAGANNLGGALPNGVPTSPQFDALPSNSYPNTTAPCGVVNPGAAGYPFSNAVGNTAPATVVACAGGDGGPGLIQLHTPSLSDILPPIVAGENIYKTVRPPPVGSTPGTGVSNFLVITGPTTGWNQMLPIFGRNSQAISKWIALGGAAVNADDGIDTPEPIQFEFEGTDAAGTGSILTTGSGSNASVTELPPVFTGVLSASPTVPPFIAGDLRTLVVAGAALSDDIYLRNPALLRRFVLRLTFGASTDLEIASASYDPGTDQLRMTVSGSGMPLTGFLPGTAIQLRPRFFRVITEGTDNSLPDSSDIVVEFQATTPNAQDDPNESPGALSPWVKDISLLDPNSGGHPDYRFFRFRITFDISAQGDPLTFSTPIPSLDFIRIPFRF